MRKKKVIKHDEQCSSNVGFVCDCYAKIDILRELLNVPDELRIGQHIVNKTDDTYYISDVDFINILK